MDRRIDANAKVSRRLLLAGAASAVALTACTSRTSPVGASSEAVELAEKARRHVAGVREVSLVAAVSTIDLGGRQVSTWAYGDLLPGPEIRCTAGQTLRVQVTNRLPIETSVHWHGLAIRNDMDGVPGLSGPSIKPAATTTFEFVTPDPGTYWFHPHSGTQLDRGLYAPLIVDDPAEALGYDAEWVIVLDDWTDGGVGPAPDSIMQSLKSGSTAGMGGMGGMGGMSAMNSGLLGGDAGDVDYPLYLVNGKSPESPDVLTAKPKDRIRLRVINAAADTAFRFSLDQHQMVVTHTDGFPVSPVTVDQILIGMGERYDVIVALGDGVFQFLAVAEGKGKSARALVRTGAGSTPPVDLVPTGMTGKLLEVQQLVAAESVRLPNRKPDREHLILLSGDMANYRWTINGKTFDETEPLPVQQGERVRLRFQNHSMMWHPMHVHGHTLQLVSAGGVGARKDTLSVLPMRQVVADLDASNPGQWMIHCHNVYHMEAGMMTVLSYVA